MNDVSVTRKLSSRQAGSIRALLATLVALLSLAVKPTLALEVWNGPSINFTNFSSADVDQITPSVWITRGSRRGLYNPVIEGGYTHSLSPIGTEWAFGELTNYASLNYKDWEDWFGGAGGGGPPSTVGKDAVLHVIPEDVYISVKFTSWTIAGSGFSYTRSTPALVPEPSTALSFTTGLALLGLRFHKRRRR